MMVPMDRSNFTRPTTVRPAREGIRPADALATSPMPKMEGSTSRSRDQQELRFKELCETRLFLDTETQQQAWALFVKCEPFIAASAGLAGNSLEDTENLWRACALHTIKKLSRGLTAGFTLTQLLRASDINLVDFLNEFNHYLQHAGSLLTAEFGTGVENRLQVKELQEDFVKLTVLFSKYKKDYVDFFSLEPSQGPLPAFSSPPRRSGTSVSPALSSSRPFRLGWLLLVVAKAEVLPPFPDLVTYGNLLIAILNLLILHMPHALRTFTFSDAVRFPVRGPEGVDVLGSLCATYQADREAVLQLMTQVASLLATHLPSPFRRPLGDQDAGVDTGAGGYCYFPGLLEGGQLDAAIRGLEKRYTEVLQRGGDVDERSFLDPTPTATLGTPAHLTPISKHRTTLERPPMSPMHPTPVSFSFPSMPSPFRGVAASPYTSPRRGGYGGPDGRAPPATPFSSVMMTATWLRTTIAPLPLDPPPALLAVFRGCDPNPEAVIIARTERVLTAIFPTSAGSGPDAREGGDVLSMGSVLDRQWARVRREESTKLYWRVLGSILAGEARAGRSNAAGVLLSGDTFHRCLLALCSELVLASHKSTLMAFPAVLKPARVTAFDLIKVIEALVRAEEGLPRELKRHLNSIEEKILESLAWERGSSMYSSLYQLRKSQSTPEAREQLAEMERLQLLPRALPANVAPEKTTADMDVAGAQAEATTPRGEATGGKPWASEAPQATANAPATSRGDEMEVEAGPGPGSQAAATEEQGERGFRNWRRGASSEAGGGIPMSPLRSRGGAGVGKRAENVINMLTQKVLKLLAMRLRAMADRLALRRGVVEAVYALLQHTLQSETHLFFLRHIDQLLLCSIYGVCKVCKLECTFKDIIGCYRKQPQYRPDTIRTVALKQCGNASEAGSPPRPESGDVIKLYNQIFVPRVKTALLRVAQDTAPPAEPTPAELPAAPSSPPRGPAVPAPLPGSPFANLPAAAFSPKKVASGIYVSPLKGHRAGQYSSATPRSSVLVLGQADDFQSPSQALARLSDQVNAAKPLRRLGQLNFDEGPAPAANGDATTPKATPSRRPSADSTREETSGWSSGTSNGSPTRPPKRQKTVQ